MSDKSKPTLTPNSLNRKFSRFDNNITFAKDVGLLDEDFSLDTALIGSAYLVGLGADYGVKDIDLYTSDKTTFEHLKDKVDVVYPSENNEMVAHVNLNQNWNIGIPLECFNGLPTELGFSDKDAAAVEEMLDESLENPYDVVYDGDNLRVSLPDPETYAATKSHQGELSYKHKQQLREIDELLGTEVSAEYVAPSQ